MPTAVLCFAQVVEERCEYRVNPENSNWTEVKREAWVSSSLFGVSRAIQVSSSSKAAAQPPLYPFLVLIFTPFPVVPPHPHELLRLPEPSL